MKKCKAFLAAALVMTAALSTPFTALSAAGDDNMDISIDLGAETKEISPYIYGINQYGNQKNYTQVSVNSIRQGGNRMTAYNWENNASNAGSDWKYSSDNNLSDSDDPADCAQVLSKEAETYNIAYKLTTLQMAGYVAADKDGPVSEEESAPSDRWNEVVLTKGSEFADTPDLTDGKVYMDEYVNYLINTLGDSTTATGIQGYSLDNEPALWHHTHSRIHPKQVTIKELSEKSVEMATAIKKLDPKADVFGPSLFGYMAYVSLADDDSSNEWETIKSENNYHWYLDCYLDQMNKASEEAGVRLLDALDIHYYSEARGQCRVTECTDSSHTDCIKARLQSVRSLYEEGYVEDSWIGQWGKENLPILPNVQASIDKYYPGTKLAITEYNFGGNDVSGTVAHAEALGCFADAGVYLATIWGGNAYQFSAINLYTNYDGKGSAFGNMLVPTKTDDVSMSSAYASIQDEDHGTVTAMITNKDLENEENAVITLKNSDATYEAAAVYAVYGDSSDIRLIDIIDKVEGNVVNVTLPACSAAMVVITDDASDFEGLELFDPDKLVQKTETFEDIETMINGNGFVEVPISDPEHLVRIDITGNVTSEAGSSWATAGCAVCMNAETADGEGFWTYKDFSLALGSGVSTSVDFDGILLNEDVPVEAVIADGKVELQKWWDASEKSDTGGEDVVNLEITKVVVVYEYENTGEEPTESESKPTEGEQPTDDVNYGDVNCDGMVDILDVILLNRNLLGMADLTKEGKANADVDLDGKPTPADSLNIMKYLVKLIEKLPVTE
ncbi:MAG: glycoside hydrolase [Oscillospiraceae bacterium]|nr:glycoside hydrolase [Oscillospiraceae bacterium]